MLASVSTSTEALAQKKAKVVIDAPAPVAKAVQAALGKKYDGVMAAKSLSDVPLTKEIREACQPHGAIAVIVTRAAPGGYSMQVLSAADGTPLDTIAFAAVAKKPVKALPKTVAAQLLAALDEARPNGAPKPAEPPPTVAAPAQTPAAVPAPASVTTPSAPAPAKQPEPAAEPPTTVASSSASSSSPLSSTAETDSSKTAFRGGFGFRAINRSLTYDKTKSEALATYSLPFAAAVAVDGEWYPAAPFTTNFLSNVAVTASGDFVVGLTSLPAGDNTKFGTSALRVRAGLLVRLPVGTNFEATAGAAYSSQTFAIASTSPDGKVTRPLLPGVAFNGPRATVGARLNHLGPVSLDVAGGFVYAVGKGEIAGSSFFPFASAFGVDATFGAAVELSPRVHARLGVDWARYFITLNAITGATLQAKTAADQYLGANLGLYLVL